MPSGKPWSELVVFLGYGQYCPDGAALHLLARCRFLADRLGSRLTALVLGQELPASAVAAAEEGGADEIVSLEAPALAHYHAEAFARAVVNLLRERGPGLFLLPNTLEATEVAPAVAG